MPKRSGLYERIYTVARQISPGKVSTCKSCTLDQDLRS